MDKADRLDANEALREAAERRRESAELARQVQEQSRVDAEATRNAAMEAVRDTAYSLQATLDQMKVTEDLRRTLHKNIESRKIDP